jgi:hypothetical protein
MAEDKSLKNSKLVLDGTPEEQAKYSALIDKRRANLVQDKDERKRVYQVRNDFNIGNQAKYTNIVGLQQKEKKGHANSVINYAGKTITKMAYALANNPPKLDFPVDTTYTADDPDYDTEESRTQAVENSIYEVFKRNKFWLRGFRRGVFNQVKVGDYAIKIYPCNVGTLDNPIWEIKIINHEKMENLLVGWRGDDSRAFDYVIAEELRSVQSIEEEFGIKVDEDDIMNEEFDEKGITSSHNNNNEWGTKNLGSTTMSILPSGHNNVPSAWVREYDDENVYALKIGKKLVQLAFKDGKSYPKIKFWILGENIPNTGSHWSIADIDYLIDPQIEMNEASNEERDYIRVGANQKFVAYNMEDFDPETMKTGSGGVIFVNSSDGSAKFEPLQTNVNNYSADSYLNRMKKHLHDLGIPEVAYGAGNGESGKKGAIDYQTIVDLISFKQDSWELTIIELCEKIQILLEFYFRDVHDDIYSDARSGEFKLRIPDFDWVDIVPTTQSDKIVNVVNKMQMGLPFRYVWQELGYRDVDAVMAEMKKEAQDKDLMMFRSKMWQLADSIAKAQQDNAPQPDPNANVKKTVQIKADAATPSGQALLQDLGMPTGGASQPNIPGMQPASNTPSPTLTTSQNDGGAMPISQADGTTAPVSTPSGTIDQSSQNAQAAGGQ